MHDLILHKPAGGPYVHRVLSDHSRSSVGVGSDLSRTTVGLGGALMLIVSKMGCFVCLDVLIINVLRAKRPCFAAWEGLGGSGGGMVKDEG